MDTGMFIIVFFVFAIVCIIGYFVFDEIKPEIMADFTEPTANATVTDLHSRYPSTMDGAFVFAFVLMWGLTLVASFMLDTHPIFFIFTIILLAFIIVVGALLSNAYEELSTDAEFGTVATNFPMTNFLMNNLLISVMAIGFTIAIAIFAKFKLMSGGGI